MNGTEMVLKIGRRQGWSYLNDAAREDDAASFDRVIQGHDPTVVRNVFQRLWDGWKIGRRIQPGDLLEKLNTIPKQTEEGRNNKARNEWVKQRRRELFDQWLMNNPDQAFCRSLAQVRAHDNAMREHDFMDETTGPLVLSPREVALCEARRASWKQVRAA